MACFSTNSQQSNLSEPVDCTVKSAEKPHAPYDFYYDNYSDVIF